MNKELKEAYDDKLAFIQFKQSRVYSYLQTKLQEKYDIICSMFIECYKQNLEDGCKEYLARKFEIEEIAYFLDIQLLKQRSIYKLIEGTMPGEEKYDK